MKIVRRCTLILLVAYVGVCLVLMFFENALLFRPSPAQDWIPPPVIDIEDVDLTSADGTRIHAWWLPCPGANHAVLYCHGNAGNLSYRGGSIVKLRELLKAHVLIFDYPGYGKSGGRPSEQSCSQAADAAYAYLTEKQNIKPQAILLYGGSMGGAVAVDVASRKSHRALVLVKAFTSIPDVGAYHFPWLPVRWLVRNRFDNMSKIKACQRPVFIAHGTHDTLVPFAQGKRLFEAANEPKEFFAHEGADHNDPLPMEFFGALQGFLEKNP
jgi:fermentation-respiration switch protein FrsA (DUF1100 family)